MSSAERMTNRLVHETSPYLLQHAHNPVDWFAWGNEAFEKARREDKPIFLSVGYSTCHWCHVMERESFENPDIAALLNENFVPVKVDREERPDVDQVYMTYVQAVTGSGGWPMSVWLTPDLKPFMGGTYFPPEDRWGHPGFASVLHRIAEAWHADRDSILQSSDTVMKRLQDATSALHPPRSEKVPGKELVANAYRRIRNDYDPQHGGFGGAPKFPRPVVPGFLLRHFQGTGETEARDMALHTLRQMARGGMFDHLGGGFHRYSVDERWHVPHFEKMLYDQAQLVHVYLDAWQVSRARVFASVVRRILDYVLQSMTGGEGQFHSAEDADSPRPETPREKAEGAFYVWTWQEIVEALGDEATLFAFHYGVEKNGNVRTDPHGEFAGKNILFLAHTDEETAERFGLPQDEARRRLETARQRLLTIRGDRPRPHLDDKALAAWNGLMIGAFARAYRILGDKGDLRAAQRAAEFLRKRLFDSAKGVLSRSWRAGTATGAGHATDYAFAVDGLLELYEAEPDDALFAWCLALQQKQDSLFWDDQSGGYYSTSGQDASILLRSKEYYDGAEPSPNSVSAMNLLRLWQITGNAEYRQAAQRVLVSASGVLGEHPEAMPLMMAALRRFLGSARHIVIAGTPEHPGTQTMLRALRERFLPNTMGFLADGGPRQAELAKRLPHVRDMTPLDGKPAAYVCEGQACRQPVTDLDSVL